MRRYQQVAVLKQRVAGVARFVIEHIQRGAAQVAIAQQGVKGVQAVNHATACQVDEV